MNREDQVRLVILVAVAMLGFTLGCILHFLMQRVDNSPPLPPPATPVESAAAPVVVAAAPVPACIWNDAGPGYLCRYDDARGVKVFTGAANGKRLFKLYSSPAVRK